LHTPTYLILGGQEDPMTNGVGDARAVALARRPAKRATAEDVQVQVEDALSRPGAAVHGDAEVATSVRLRDLDRDAGEVAHQRVVFGSEIGERGDVLPGHDQDVRRRGGVDVGK